jgi:(1->4)-alpha-D-glucan 1-alpha-D-glucosylmutase
VTKRSRVEPGHIPTSTYRLQMNGRFTFEDAVQLADYLAGLGIGDCYLSPFLMAAPGSMHGYDITDPTRVNPEIGTREDVQRLSERLKQYGMGIIADVVPNHMCIDDAANRWWWDVLENGPSSPFARYFDIDWNPPKRDLANKVLLPILGDQYGRILEDQQITVGYERGGFVAFVNQKSLPLDPCSWALILDPAAEALKKRLGDTHEHVLELESILTALSHLAPAYETDPAKVQERQREKEIIRKRLAALVDSSTEAREEIEASRRQINGVKGDSRSFDRLEELLSRQSYRLAFWRVAADEINYRRFFDINQLAAIRVDDPEVFYPVHALLMEMIHEGQIDGLRVDHSDGLWDPAEYFHRLQAAAADAKGSAQPFYIVTEKILVGNEALRSDWNISGTTGYDFLGLVNGVFVDGSRRRAFYRLYETFTGCSLHFEDLNYACKRLILQTSMSGELNVLANKLDKISEGHRWSRDFTRASLQHALRETIACFPIYRTYTTDRAEQPDPEDERHIRNAIRSAKRRNQSTDESVFDFLQRVLLLEDPAGISDAQRAERRDFVMSMQQITGPVVAKGIEDTAFYRSAPLASLNDVGSDPRQFGISPAGFHARNQARLEAWPHALLATSTHDSKRSEDVRARINVLSEIPGDWYRAIRSWREINLNHKTTSVGAEIPSPAEEYLFYQTLVGIWPLRNPGPAEQGQLTQRVQAYMRKALREAKVHSSWINTNQSYEEAVDTFVAAALEPSPENHFLSEFIAFVEKIKAAGLWNSLSQTLLKIASPGVPDFYQGNEIWDFSLVDPDNRRPVDYDLRRGLLNRLRQMESQAPSEQIDAMIADPSDGALKMYLTRRALCFRKSNRDLLENGSYVPLRTAGDRQNHAVAFARTRKRNCVIAVASRFFMALGADKRKPTGPDVWGDSALLLRRDLAHTAWREVLSQTTIESDRHGKQHRLPLSRVFAHLPVALLHAVE